jgi:hypothetical protein
MWKLQVDGGVPSCVLRMDTAAIITKGPKLVDGWWTEVECRKNGAALEIYITGELAGSTPLPSGLIDNTGTARPMIGANGLHTKNDQFRGGLDGVFLIVDGESPPATPGRVTVAPQ